MLRKSGQNKGGFNNAKFYGKNDNMEDIMRKMGTVEAPEKPVGSNLEADADDDILGDDLLSRDEL